MTLEHSARIAHARQILADFREAHADESTPFDPAGWAGALAGALEMALAADANGDFVLVSCSDLDIALNRRNSPAHWRQSAEERLRAALEGRS